MVKDTPRLGKNYNVTTKDGKVLKDAKLMDRQEHEGSVTHFILSVPIVDDDGNQTGKEAIRVHSSAEFELVER
jgi:hypothetical protein